MGIFEMNCLLSSGFWRMTVFISVAMGPLMMPLTVIFSGASSSDSARVKPSRLVVLAQLAVRLELEDLLFVGDIGGKDFDGGAEGAGAFGGFRELFGVARDEGQVGPGAAQRESHGAAQAAAGTGDQGDSAGEFLRSHLARGLG